jgi:hypothetical protein
MMPTTIAIMNANKAHHRGDRLYNVLQTLAH